MMRFKDKKSFMRLEKEVFDRISWNDFIDICDSLNLYLGGYCVDKEGGFWLVNGEDAIYINVGGCVEKASGKYKTYLTSDETEPLEKDLKEDLLNIESGSFDVVCIGEPRLVFDYD